ncbi:hypothetical protein ACFV5J_23370 [Streptomyces zaomyceticus]|uniref:hypothetical protein n=1 Tax=Streptomyces zaomyceticus TaxID=68286 RepID=UPI003654D975
MADCVHHIDLCPDCQGLRTVRLDRPPGVTTVTLNGEPSALTPRGPATVYIGPAPGPCPNQPPPEAPRG